MPKQKEHNQKEIDSATIGAVEGRSVVIDLRDDYKYIGADNPWGEAAVKKHMGHKLISLSIGHRSNEAVIPGKIVLGSFGSCVVKSKRESFRRLTIKAIDHKIENVYALLSTEYPNHFDAKRSIVVERMETINANGDVCSWKKLSIKTNNKVNGTRFQDDKVVLVKFNGRAVSEYFKGKTIGEALAKVHTSASARVCNLKEKQPRFETVCDAY